MSVLAYLGNIASRRVLFQAPGFPEVGPPHCFSPRTASSAVATAESPYFKSGPPRSPRTPEVHKSVVSIEVFSGVTAGTNVYFWCPKQETNVLVAGCLTRRRRPARKAEQRSLQKRATDAHSFHSFPKRKEDTAEVEGWVEKRVNGPPAS